MRLDDTTGEAVDGGDESRLAEKRQHLRRLEGVGEVEASIWGNGDVASGKVVDEGEVAEARGGLGEGVEVVVLEEGKDGEEELAGEGGARHGDTLASERSPAQVFMYKGRWHCKMAAASGEPVFVRGERPERCLIPMRLFPDDLM